MIKTVAQLKALCEERQWTVSEYILQTEAEEQRVPPEEIMEQFLNLASIMEASSRATLESGSQLDHGIIDDFAKKTWDYAQEDRIHVTDKETLEAMARAFSTFETNSGMGKIVAAPTAGSSGIVPAALYTAREKLGASDEDLARGLMVAACVGQFIGGYATFAGSEGGCQAECGAASAMAAGALVELFGGSVDQVFQAASIAIVNILGLVCDPIGGLVQYPCTFRNASGVNNARISADLALAGTTSIIPFEEVCQAMKEVGDAMDESLRETGVGGLAGTPTGHRICQNIFGNCHKKK
ncbi:MAG: L-serine ammonia-lyase, iron-sulfur-dependent, subunit alpha [Tissierellia bacterium]|nr:L-serine ammonia-lyase, iron-sulfur-dependent, subunit alpha [Tissierellia bacterium]